MNRCRIKSTKLITGTWLSVLAAAGAFADPLEWSELQPIPVEFGFAGAFTGSSGGALIVAGGANFPDGYPWEDGDKIYHDRIFVQEEAEGSWRVHLCAHALHQRSPHHGSALRGDRFGELFYRWICRQPRGH